MDDKTNKMLTRFINGNVPINTERFPYEQYVYHYCAVQDLVRNTTFDGIVRTDHPIATDGEYNKLKKFIFNCSSLTTLHRIMTLNLIHIQSSATPLDKDY